MDLQDCRLEISAASQGLHKLAFVMSVSEADVSTQGTQDKLQVCADLE